MNRLYSELYYVLEAQNSIKRSIFRLLEIRESDGDDDDDIPLLKKPNVTDIEINGIPEEQAESLQYILTRLSRHMFNEVFPNQVEIIYRLTTSKKPRPIIVNMKSPVTVHELLTAYNEYNERNRHSNLNTRDLGFSGWKIPVLLSEHPSKLNKAHRRQVRQKIKKYKHKKRARRSAAKASGKDTAPKAIGNSTAKKNGDNHSTATFTENTFEIVAGSSASYTAGNRPSASNTNNRPTTSYKNNRPTSSNKNNRPTASNMDTMPTASNKNNRPTASNKNNRPNMNNSSEYTSGGYYCRKCTCVKANIDEDSSDDDANYTKSRTFRNSKERTKYEREERQLELQNELNMQKLRETSINKKGPKSLHKKSKPGSQVKRLRDLALVETNKVLFG